MDHIQIEGINNQPAEIVLSLELTTIGYAGIWFYVKYCDIFGVRVVEVSKGNGGKEFDFMQMIDISSQLQHLKCQKLIEG